MNIRNVAIIHIRRDGGTQARAAMDSAAIDEYSAAMAEGAKFPPVVLFQDHDIYWLGDGFHRLAAAEKAGKKSIQADIRMGGQRQARLFALGANITHGIRRSNADKRLAVSILLEDPEWSQWSNNKIAQAVGVSHQFVNNMRSEQVATVASSSHHEVSEPEPIEPDEEPGEETVEEEVSEDDRISYLREPAEEEKDPPSALAPKPEPSGNPGELEELRARNAELQSRLDTALEVIEQLTAEVEAARRTLDAEDIYQQFQKEIVRAQEMARVTKARNFGLMDEVADLKGMLKSARRKLEKFEKAGKAVA